MKGIVLAGGEGTRLYPMTLHIGKSALPIHDKPMIYYPVSTLMTAGIKDILIISTPRDLPFFEELLRDGSQLGMNFYYKEQPKPRGLADAFIVGKEFIGKDNVALILGDNVFHGDLTDKLDRAINKKEGATIFGYRVSDPERYGVIEFDKDRKPVSIKEKPKNPKSDYAVVGLYFYDNEVIKIAEELTPSKRGELEITDVNSAYLQQGNLNVELLGEGFAWLDTGTPESLGEASIYIETIQKRQNTLIGSPEEIAFRNGWIDKQDLENLVKEKKLDKSEYGKYLLRLTKPNIL